MKQSHIRITERDHRILRHVQRQRMTTVDAVQALFFADKSRDAAKSTLRRLYGRAPDYRFLHPEPLDRQRVYYRLTPDGARLIGAAQDATRPLGLQARIQRYALLWFFCLDAGHKRSPFHPRKFPQQFDLKGERLPQNTFFIEETENGDARLGYTLIDHRADTRRLVRKAGTLLQRFLRRGWFDDYFRAGAFALSVLTATEEKRQSLERGLRRRLPEFVRPHRQRLGLPANNTLPLELSVRVVPGLIDVLSGIPQEGHQ